MLLACLAGSSSVSFVNAELLAGGDLHILSCTPGKVIVDDPNFPAFPESAEEAHARINAVLEVSILKMVFCMPMFITLQPVTAADHCAGNRQSISWEHTGSIPW